MRSSHTQDRIATRFDDRHLIADAGLLLPATLAEHLGLRELFDAHVDLGSNPGRAHVGDNAFTLIMSALAGGDCIDDADALRAGASSAVLAHAVAAPSTLGTFLRSFSWGHARQLDRVSRAALVRAWAGGAGPGSGSLTILYGSYPRRVSAPDYPWAHDPAWWQRYAEDLERHWGTDAFDIELRWPSHADDPQARAWWVESRRRSMSPGAARALAEMNAKIDVRHVLPAIGVPTLILNCVGDRVSSIEGARYMAERIPGAKIIELPGEDHIPSKEVWALIFAEVQEFLTGVRPLPEADRVLATVLFTDIVNSTAKATELGDHGWRELVERHHGLVRSELERYSGREMDTAGDGFFATFDGPGRAIRCAVAIRDGLANIGIVIRAGLHTGETEMIAGKAGGIAVITAARVREQAEPGEVLVSSTVHDLVAGSGIAFADRGVQTLKGVPGKWRLFRVTA